MTMRAAWRWCAAIGVIAFTCSGLFGRIPGLIACGPTGGLAPIAAFEFARTTGDIAAMFGSEPCTSTFVAAQKTGLLLDGLAFIPSYTGFLILAAIAAGARGQVKAVMITMFLAAAISDEIEGFLLNAILDHLPGTPALLGALWWAVRVKFALLALGTIQISALVGTKWTKSWIRRVFGSAIFGGGFFALLTLFTVSDWMMRGFLVAWVALLLTALMASFAPSLFVATAAPRPDQAAPSA